MQMTIDESLSETKRLWTIYAKDGSLKKGADVANTGYLNNCPCCEYVRQKVHTENFEDGTCRTHCPLKDKWSNHGWPYYMCKSRDSPYFKWHFRLGIKHDCYDRAFMAGVIVELVDEVVAERQRETSLEYKLDMIIFNLVGELTEMKHLIHCELNTLKYQPHPVGDPDRDLLTWGSDFYRDAEL